MRQTTTSHRPCIFVDIPPSDNLQKGLWMMGSAILPHFRVPPEGELVQVTNRNGRVPSGWRLQSPQGRTGSLSFASPDSGALERTRTQNNTKQKPVLWLRVGISECPWVAQTKKVRKFSWGGEAMCMARDLQNSRFHWQQSKFAFQRTGLLLFIPEPREVRGDLTGQELLPHPHPLSAEWQ